MCIKLVNLQLQDGEHETPLSSLQDAGDKIQNSNQFGSDEGVRNALTGNYNVMLP